MKNIEFRVKPMKSYHVVGKLITDRSKINERVDEFSLSLKKNEDRLEEAKEENKYIWNRYID